MIRTQIQLTAQQSDRLKMISTEERLSIAELIRRSIDHFLQFRRYSSREELKKKSLSVVGKYTSDPENIALHHDDYLATIYAEVGQ